jgi:hypothetical protein
MSYVSALQCILEECGWEYDEERDVWEVPFSTRPWLPGRFVREVSIREKRAEILDAVTAASDLDPEVGPWIKPIVDRIALPNNKGGNPPREWKKKS